ncbi:MAG: MATE family efflux transporter, partial [Gammaproteobacteria bacterium]|nr:MATE family efflux transporter [Gammaproteobacteria bacterium]
MTSRRPRLTQGSVGRHLVGMTVPVFFGIFTMMLQSFVDMWFIGKVGDWELAALSFAFPVIMVVSSVAIGLGAGTSSVVARALGADNHRRARRLSTDSLILSFLITAVVSIIGVLTIAPLFRLLGAPEDMIPLIGGYMKILYTGVPFIVVSMVGIATMRATGDTRLPGLLMVLASVTNIILDPILIFGLGPIPAMELNGAALAALLSRASIFAGVVYLMRYRLDFLTFSRPDPAELVRSWKDILHVGIPAAGTNAIIPIATGVITAMLAKYGPEAVAGFGVASRIESLTLVFFYSLSAIIGPFVGQNISANRADRIYRALWLCTVFCLSFGLVVAGLLAATGSWLPSLFSDNADVISVATKFLVIVPVSYGTYGMVMVMNASFNGMGKPMPAVHISVGRMVVIYVPLAFLLDPYFGVAGIFA